MQYNYFNYGYHPKDTSCEVTAMLMGDDERHDFASKAVKDALLICHEYSHDGYIIESERAFNPVTDQQATFNYVEHAHKLSFRYDSFTKNNKEKKIWEEWLAAIVHTWHEIGKEFKSVIEHIIAETIAKANTSHKETDKTNELHNRYKNNSHEKIEIEKPEINVQYTIHPHVDALINQRNHSDAGHLR
jgi:hypothetical protein